jgi:hypothetical protein
MLKFIFVLFMLLQSLFSGLSEAIEVTNLYQASVDVDSQAPAQRQIATQKALQEVLLKVGGRQSILSNTLLQQAITSAERYQTQFHYQRKNNQLSVVINFNDKKVNQLFKQAKLPLWGSLRPQVLLWLIDEIDSQKTLISDDVSLPINSVINKFSVVRGLPVIMPSSVLVNENTYQISDFWEYFLENIQQASQRYLPDTHVVMRISDSRLVSEQAPKPLNTGEQSFDCGILCMTPEVTKTIELDWRIYSQDTLYMRQYQGKDKESLIQQGLSDITEFIYQSYALLTTTENDLVIEIRNINSLLTDTTVFNFISSLSSVNNIILLNAKGNVRRYKLDLVGSEESFFAALKLNKKLKKHIEPKIISHAIIDDISERGDRQFTNDLETSGKVFRDQQTTSQNVSDQTTLTESIPKLTSQLKAQMKIVILGEGNKVKTTLSNKIVPEDHDKDDTARTVLEGTMLHDTADTEKPNGETRKVTNQPVIPVFYWEQ